MRVSSRTESRAFSCPSRDCGTGAGRREGSAFRKGTAPAAEGAPRSISLLALPHRAKKNHCVFGSTLNSGCGKSPWFNSLCRLSRLAFNKSVAVESSFCASCALPNRIKICPFKL
jgi:hypothetical protein